ncbi:MAG: toll/interleukin-1 receptor domain-containing protein, partial [Pseudomonadota bacterium]
MTSLGRAKAKRYKAFLSYANEDRRSARWLHRRLERYRTPKHLRRDHGAPRRLAPVFRDREELPAGAPLSDRLNEALRNADYLIVIGSEHAAASEWVSKEVSTFKGLDKGERIIPVLTEDLADDTDFEQAFPPALHRLVEVGDVTEEPDPVERVGADLRASGDGKREGFLKVVAGLIGVDFGEVKRRELEAQRRRTIFAYSLVGLFALLAIATGFSAWRAVEQTRLAEAQLSRAEAALLTVLNGVSDIVNQVAAGAERGEITTSVANALLQTANKMVQGVGQAAEADPRLKVQQARLQQQLSRHYARVGDG